ncbi:hypothetical protein OG689_23085 [Kitasatospora sp. NBC_00240]|uniref:hypothetical protein n=1 Tax=Kitasatospora sp. NBC_00240 TaxID=2903567 RepID=UPI002257276E|nr:hypothetical protein [Kitasatospora sp. NBC_00240]MCX5212130.1 hypothetical protein [Kitasatospora sp. NBC_00240]
MPVPTPVPAPQDPALPGDVPDAAVAVEGSAGLLGPGGGRGPDPAAGPGERPLTDCLADYWQGDFTLRDTPDDGPEAAATAAATARAGLGPSGITVRGRDLATLLDPAYRAFTS